MSTSYYLHLNTCKQCKIPLGSLHIGTSSEGWYFSLHVENIKMYPEQLAGTVRANDNGHIIQSLDDWKTLFADNNNTIVDEYGRDVSVDDMLKIICERSAPDRPSDWEVGRKLSGECEIGVNNLLRQKTNWFRCMSHAPNNLPYSHMVGSFS